jgi:hypothetical protein
MKPGGETRKRDGRTSAFMWRSQPSSGFVMKPAQMTKPAGLGGRVAANLTANGVEKDSASTTNGSAVGITSPTQEESSV